MTNILRILRAFADFLQNPKMESMFANHICLLFAIFARFATYLILINSPWQNHRKCENKAHKESRNNNNNYMHNSVQCTLSVCVGRFVFHLIVFLYCMFVLLLLSSLYWCLDYFIFLAVAGTFRITHLYLIPIYAILFIQNFQYFRKIFFLVIFHWKSSYTSHIIIPIICCCCCCFAKYFHCSLNLNKTKKKHPHARWCVFQCQLQNKILESKRAQGILVWRILDAIKIEF